MVCERRDLFDNRSLQGSKHLSLCLGSEAGTPQHPVISYWSAGKNIPRKGLRVRSKVDHATTLYMQLQDAPAGCICDDHFAKKPTHSWETKTLHLHS
ncbi:hypothetical protein TNCV_3519091 [Trichonephila clavipes]|uniref:Uncharacterized protein n=1 Tax=Trichonephila clavipes TaxID=2585209 RepID=A0A8X6VLH1_TRICX|nr:hypothetical protein TNCV_3519091 [Trichonephila clavipes]